MDTTIASVNYPGQNLLDVMNQGQWSLLNPMMQQQDTASQQASQNLAATRQATTQQAEMHPLLMQETQARTNQYGAASRLSAAQAAGLEDSLKVLQSIPMDQRVATAVKEHAAKASAADLQMMGDRFKTLAPYAAAAAANKGVLPLEMQQELQTKNPALLPYLANPQAVAKTSNAVQAFLTSTPEYVKDTAVAKIHNQGTKQVAEITSAASERSAKYAADKAYSRAQLQFGGDALRMRYGNSLPGQINLAVMDKRKAEIAAREAEMDPEFGVNSPEYKAAIEAYKDAYIRETKAREQHALAAVAGAAVKAAGTPDISATTGGAVPGVTAPTGTKADDPLGVFSQNSPPAPAAGASAPAKGASQPAGPKNPAPGVKPIYATNGKQRIQSTDGGKTWEPAQ